MGSQSGSGSRGEVKYVLTGFSAFHGVDRNPTEDIITELVEFCERNGEGRIKSIISMMPVLRYTMLLQLLCT